MTENGPRVVKRYANRKLYDMRDSRYVTLDQISEMIRQGEDVKVIDNSSKEDLTSVTLAQILFEEERKRSFLPLSALRKVIQSGGESLQEFVTQISDTAGRVFHRREDEAGKEGEPGESGEKPKERGGEADVSKMVREFFDGIQSTIDNWQKALDANINSAIESVSPLAPLHKEVEGLRERIAELEAKLAQVEGTPKPPSP